MKKLNGNYIKVTIHKAKICSEVSVSPYSLKLELNKKSYETEKINGKEVELGGKSFFYEIPYGTNQISLDVSAMTTTLFIFDSQLAKVSIPININKLDDRRQWFYLKNSKDENVISVLTSIYCEIKPASGGNSSYMVSPNCDISLVNKSGMNHNQYINQTQNNVNVRYSNLNNVLNNINNLSTDDARREIKFKLKYNNENTIVYDNCKSPDLSTISNNLFSPYSHRHEDKILNETNMGTVDSFFDNNFDTVKIHEDPNIINKLKNKFSFIREEQEKLKKANEEIIRNKEKLRQNERILLKEKEKLENHIRIFKSQKLEYDNKNGQLINNYSKLNNEISKFKCEKDLFNFERNLILNLNIIQNSSKIINNLYSENYKVEFNDKLSVNNLTLWRKNQNLNNTGILCSNNISVPNIKKEVILENPQNFILSDLYIKKERNISKDKTIKTNSENQNSCNNISIMNTLNSNIKASLAKKDLNLTIGANSILSENSNTLSIIPNQKGLNHTTNTKFYTPTIQIDLRKDQNGLSKPIDKIEDSQIPNFEQKSNAIENKLLDSLDNLNLMYSSKKNIKINKLRRKGSDEIKPKDKKVEERKKLINKNMSPNFALTHNNIKEMSQNIINIKEAKTNINFGIQKNSSDKLTASKKEYSGFSTNTNSSVSGINSLNSKEANLYSNYYSNKNSNSSIQKINSIKKIKN